MIYKILKIPILILHMYKYGMLASLSADPALKEVARAVEASTTAIIEDAAA